MPCALLVPRGYFVEKSLGTRLRMNEGSPIISAKHSYISWYMYGCHPTKENTVSKKERISLSQNIFQTVISVS